MATIYRLANAGGEFNKLYALAKHQGIPLKAGTLNFPTVLAEREGKVIGFLSTLPEQQVVLAGPLVMARPSLHVAVKLADAYEVVLKMAGVKTYLIQTDPARPEWADMLERMGFEVMDKNESRIQLRRDIA